MMRQEDYVLSAVEVAQGHALTNRVFAHAHNELNEVCETLKTGNPQLALEKIYKIQDLLKDYGEAARKDAEVIFAQITAAEAGNSTTISQ